MTLEKIKKIIKEEIRKLINEGGNITIQTKDGTEYSAQKVDFSQVSRSGYRRDFVKAFLKLNKLFNDKFGYFLWENEEIIKTGFIFNGSSQFVFSDDIPDDEFVQYKRFVGDIDITVPKDELENVLKLLQDYYEKSITSNINLIGTNKIEGKTGRQINALFQYNVPEKEIVIYMQVDFQASEYEGGKPSAFAKFSHSANWEDIKASYKGVSHKYLLTAVVKALSYKPDVVILTDKSPLPPDKYRIKTQQKPYELSFSVDRGVRTKLQQQFYPDGTPIKIDGKLAYKEIPTAESDYETKVDTIYQMIFDTKPTNEDLEKFNSFLGLIKLLKKNKTNNDFINDMYDILIKEKCFGPASQLLSKDEKEDYEIKWGIINKLYEEFPYLKSNYMETKKMSDEYYSQYTEKSLKRKESSLKKQQFGFEKE